MIQRILIDYPIKRALVLSRILFILGGWIRITLLQEARIRVRFFFSKRHEFEYPVFIEVQSYTDSGSGKSHIGSGSSQSSTGSGSSQSHSGSGSATRVKIVT